MARCKRCGCSAIEDDETNAELAQLRAELEAIKERVEGVQSARDEAIAYANGAEREMEAMRAENEQLRSLLRLWVAKKFPSDASEWFDGDEINYDELAIKSRAALGVK